MDYEFRLSGTPFKTVQCENDNDAFALADDIATDEMIESGLRESELWTRHDVPDEAIDGEIGRVAYQGYNSENGNRWEEHISIHRA